MASCGHWWEVQLKLWLIEDGSSKIMAGHGCWLRKYTWSWVVVTKLCLVVDGREWSWLVARISNAHVVCVQKYIYREIQSVIGLVRENLYVSGKSKEISSEQFADNPVGITISLIAMTIESLSSNKKNFFINNVQVISQGLSSFV